MPWGANTSIQITDGAFRKMMEDGEFKNKMMKIIREDAVGSNKMCGGTLINIDENGYKGYSYMADHAKEAGSAFAAHSKDKDAFYVKKSRKKAGVYEAVGGKAGAGKETTAGDVG